MQNCLASYNIDSKTVIGTSLMQNLINTETGDTMEPKLARNFLKSLFEELRVPLSKKEIKEIVEKCLDSEKQILKAELKNRIIQSLPPGNVKEIMKIEIKI